MKKRAMEFTLSTVIIAIILIVALVVLIFLFAQRTSIFGKSLQGLPCDQRGETEQGAKASCLPKGQSCPEGMYMIYAVGCDEDGKKDATNTKTGPCCVPLVSKKK